MKERVDTLEHHFTESVETLRKEVGHGFKSVEVGLSERAGRREFEELEERVEV